MSCRLERIFTAPTRIYLGTLLTRRALADRFITLEAELFMPTFYRVLLPSAHIREERLEMKP